MRTAETAVNTIDPERPWPGLLSFGEEAAQLFHGRTKEVQELVRLLSHETVSFLYGKSGLGKTSLLQAGLFPRLRAADRLPVYVRLSYDIAALPAKQQIFNALIAALDQAAIEGERPNATDSAWAYLHRRNFEWWSPRNKPVLPVLVFDQFEELFTIGQESGASRTLAAEVAELLLELTTHRPSTELRREFETHPELVEGFNYDATNYQLLFAFREDFLPQFDQLRERLRINPHNRLALERLNGESATESVLGTGGSLVTPAVAEDIVRFVAGERDSTDDDKPLELLEVEPWLLCLVCQQVNEQRLAAIPPQPQISSALLTGTRDLILAQYYASCVGGFDARIPAFLEDRLLTETGFRNTYPYDEAIRVDGITARVIDTLVDRRLLRKELHMGVQRVEISHDVLGPVLVRYRQQRMQQEADAIAVVRDISNKRRISEGRRRSGRFVVLTTAVLAILGVAFFLRNREATRAEDTARWGQEMQGYQFEILLLTVQKPPVPERVLSHLGSIVRSTRELRKHYPNRTQLAAQQLHFMYLLAVAGDSTDKQDRRLAALALADSLAEMPIGGSDDLESLELAYLLAEQLAEEEKMRDRATRMLRHHVALLDNPMLPTFSRMRTITAARRLARRTEDVEEKVGTLERAVVSWNWRQMSYSPAYSDEPRLIATAASDVADLIAGTDSANSRNVKRLLVVVGDAYLAQVQAAEDSYNRQPSAFTRDTLVSALGNLAWASLMTGNFESSELRSTTALRLDSSKVWIRQNLLHAQLFRGQWSSIRPEMERLRNVIIDIPPAGRKFSDVALKDIAEFRKFGLQHPDLDRYEQFFRDGK